jgi:hypothetical protein
MVTERDIKKSVSYQLLRGYLLICLVLALIPIALMIMAISFNESEAVVLMAVVSLVPIITIIKIALKMRDLVQSALSFERSIGRAVSVTGSSFRDITRLVIVFKDSMDKDYRMSTHRLFTINEMGNYMDKDLKIYYSVKLSKVLIAEVI